MKLKHLLSKARSFKKRSKHCSMCKTGTGRRRYVKRRGGSLRSIGNYLYNHKGKILLGTAAAAIKYGPKLYQGYKIYRHYNPLPQRDPPGYDLF